MCLYVAITGRMRRYASVSAGAICVPPSGVIPEISRLIDRPVLGAPDRHGPLEGIVEDQHAHLIDRPQIFDHSDGRDARQFHLAAFHRRGLVDDQHHGGAFGRARRRQLSG